MQPVSSRKQSDICVYDKILDDLREMEELPGPFLVDNMEDEASKLYGAHPERLYIILDGNIVYQVYLGLIYEIDDLHTKFLFVFRVAQDHLTMFQKKLTIGCKSILLKS